MIDWLKDIMTDSPIPLWGWVIINVVFWGLVLRFALKLLKMALTFFLPYWVD